ncbi:MAG: TonB-dependent receptor plug domain-containing protein, partial [Candidatus Omnitrophica bacterium]|nr:TonB-dependent receptor plug domain-containing protein [Candidatus Omnitrophota bacterium]
MFFFLLAKTSSIALFLSFLILTRYASASGLIELVPISIDSGTQPEILNRKLLLKDDQPVSYNSFDKIIENEFNVDIQQRGIFGIQSELTIRATNFEQNLVAIDGIAFSDPQTSHHSMNLPLTGHSWESIEVIKGLNSSLYGSHAIGGVVDFRTVNPEADSIKLSSCIGEKQLRIFGIGLDRVNELLSYHVSFERSIAASYRPETEFESYILFSKFIFHDIISEPKIVVAQSDKGFGASSFYSSNYPRQKENIKTGLYMLSFDVFHKDLCLSPVFYFRRHWDKFILDRSNP